MKMRVEHFLHFCEDYSMANLRYAGVAIQKIRAGGFHIGVLHKKEKESTEFSLLHLAWHCDLRNDQPGAQYAWIQPRYPASRLRNLAAYCRLVWKRNGPARIPYGLRFRDSRGARDGTILLGATEHGLTCATFVLVMFRAVGMELIDVANWPERDTDATWHALVIDTLRNDSSGTIPRAQIEEHVRHLEAEKGCARFRPEEVAAAASSETNPLTFEMARDIGAAITEALQTRALHGPS